MLKEMGLAKTMPKPTDTEKRMYVSLSHLPRTQAVKLHVPILTPRIVVLKQVGQDTEQTLSLLSQRFPSCSLHESSRVLPFASRGVTSIPAEVLTARELGELTILTRSTGGQDWLVPSGELDPTT